jgi:hypothetical protein
MMQLFCLSTMSCFAVSSSSAVGGSGGLGGDNGFVEKKVKGGHLCAHQSMKDVSM